VRRAPLLQRFAFPGWISLFFALTACELAIKTSDLEGGCPGGLPGPTLVKVESASGPYCIDSTEVTHADYATFINANGGGTQAHITADGCDTVTTLLPDITPWPVSGLEDFPIGRANWCQATAYCAWAGKRLCGKVGGGPVVDALMNNAKYAQWFNACSHGGTRTFPYGADYDASLCVGPPSDGGPRTPTLVGTNRGCEGGFPGLFDMSGNLWEWTDNCSGTGAMDACHACGGAFDSVAAPMNDFACSSCRPWNRTAPATDIGFRCCLDL
jgi:formylglycine-generating enzyme required for sulfatase activity